jgi:hypothetical protein
MMMMMMKSNQTQLSLLQNFLILSFFNIARVSSNTLSDPTTLTVSTTTPPPPQHDTESSK